jgi:hypothetical protein
MISLIKTTDCWSHYDLNNKSVEYAQYYLELAKHIFLLNRNTLEPEKIQASVI